MAVSPPAYVNHAGRLVLLVSAGQRLEGWCFGHCHLSFLAASTRRSFWILLKSESTSLGDRIQSVPLWQSANPLADADRDYFHKHLAFEGGNLTVLLDQLEASGLSKNEFKAAYEGYLHSFSHQHHHDE
jgi:hypothetical protein